MYICYVDESGYTGNRFSNSQPCLVAAGILVNTYGMHKTSDELYEIVDIIRNAGFNIAELKAEELYRGKGPWQRLKGTKRNKIKSEAFSKFESPYVVAGLHLALQVQRAHQKQKKNKGKTFLIFDQQDEYEKHLSDLLANPGQFYTSG